MTLYYVHPRNKDFYKEMERFGLQLNTTKSCAVSMVASGRDKKVKQVAGKSLFRVKDEFLPQLSMLDVWRYLGIDFEGANVKKARVDIKDVLENVTRAPLHPQQRMRILRTHLLPKYSHTWVMSRVNVGDLVALDKQVRTAVRTWLHLPHDVPVGYFHARIRDGGLGIPSFRYFIPLLRLRRLEKLVGSDAPHVVAASNSDLVRKQISWCKQHTTIDMVPLRNLKHMSDHFAERLYAAVDGRSLRDCEDPYSSWWVNHGSQTVSPEEFVNFQKVRSNCLPTPSRTTRGRAKPQTLLDRACDPMRVCRAGCRTAETAEHCVQVCARAHVGRLDRHNDIARELVVELKRRGWQVEEESILRTHNGLRKPDIIIAKESELWVLDVQVVSNNGSMSLADIDAEKEAKYAKIPRIREVLTEKYGEKESLCFGAVTVSLRGIWCKKSVEVLSSLGCSKGFLRKVPVMALRGTWRCWELFNRSTATVRRGR